MDEKRFVEAVRQVVREELKGFATKEDLKAFATKEDLKAFATKEDFAALKGEFLKLDEKFEFLRRDLFVRLKEMESTFLNNLHNTRQGLTNLIAHWDKEFRELKLKLELYDFDFLVKENDRLIKLLERYDVEFAAITVQQKRQEERIKGLEAKAG